MLAERDAAMRDFLGRAGWGAAALSPLPGDASTRRYVRAALNGRLALVLDQPPVEAPPCPPGASEAERRALGYNAIARLAGADCARFVAVAEFLRARGLSTPEIFASDAPDGFVLMENLGDGLYADAIPAGASEIELYRNAVEVLAELHRDGAPATLPGGQTLFAYDEMAMLAEVDLLAQWFLPLALGRPASDGERAGHQGLWRTALRGLPGERPVFVHRDYHAQNLLWLDGRRGIARTGVIDFQDALAGHIAYDLISLTEDARRDVDPALADAMTAHYLHCAKANGMALNEDAFRMGAAIMAAQRNAKIAGIFARLYKRDGKPRYLDYLPRVWRYLERDLSHPALGAVKAWYDEHIPAGRRTITPGQGGQP